MTGQNAPAHILFDACSALNLYATRHMRDILTNIPFRSAAATAVMGEALYVRRGGNGPDADEHDPVDLNVFVASGLLDVFTTETEDEIATYVDLAVDLDDGEAMTCALAIHRGFAVATDDLKVRKIARARALPLSIYTTSEILKAWSDTIGVPDPDLKQMLSDVRDCARFLPGRNDPLKSWWDAVLASH